MLSDPLDDDSFTSDYYETDAKQIPYKSIINSETEDTLIFQQLDIFSQGFHIMEEFRKEEKLCDVILKVNIVDRDYNTLFFRYYQYLYSRI